MTVKLIKDRAERMRDVYSGVSNIRSVSSSIHQHTGYYLDAIAPSTAARLIDQLHYEYPRETRPLEIKLIIAALGRIEEVAYEESYNLRYRDQPLIHDGVIEQRRIRLTTRGGVYVVDQSGQS